MKGSAVLIYPKVGDEAYAVPYMPLSVLAVATASRSAGYDVKIIDQRTDGSWTETFNSLLTEQLICIGISSMSGPQVKHAVETAEYIRGISPGLPIVWGGVHASLLPEQTLASPLADIVVLREGEETFPELLSVLEKNMPLETVRGIAFKDDTGKIKINDPRDNCDLNSYAFLDYSLIKPEAYQRQGSERITRADSVSLYTSRGCPFRCSFCYNNSFHKRKWRGQDVATVLRNIERLTEKGITRFILSDEYFFQTLERARAICQGIRERKLKTEFYFANCRADQVMRMTDEDLKLFAEVGFKDVFIGIESGSPEMLKKMQKNINVDDAMLAGRRLSEAGILVQYSFMLGLPGETADDIKQTLKLMEHLLTELPQCYVPSAGKFIPFPGTEAYNHAVESGWKPPKTLEAWGDILSVSPKDWLGEKVGSIAEQALFLTSALDMKINPRASYILETLRNIYSKIAHWRCRHGFINNVWEYKIMKSPLGGLLRKKRK